MTGLIYDIKRFALHDGPGIRTTVFFKGCSLDCWWCHNPESRRSCIETSKKITRLDGKEFETEEETGEVISVEELLERIKKDKVFMDESGGGVTFSGGEPLQQHDFLAEMLRLCRDEKIHTAIDTSGYAEPDVLRKIAALTDLFLYDIKLLEDKDHIRYTGVSNRQIFTNLDYLYLHKIPLIFRIPVIPVINDGEKMSSMISFLCKNYPGYREVHLLPYHSIALQKYHRFGIENRMIGIQALHEKDLSPLADDFIKAGYEVKIGG